jgi:hypothetical protein
LLQKYVSALLLLSVGNEECSVCLLEAYYAYQVLWKSVSLFVSLNGRVCVHVHATLWSHKNTSCHLVRKVD